MTSQRHSLPHTCRLWLLLLAGFLLLQPGARPAFARQLCTGGQADYDIIISGKASASEKTAASELAGYLRQVCGTEFTVRSARSQRRRGGTDAALPRHIYVGYDATLPVFAGKTAYADTDESFEYRTQGEDILIFGGRQRGTMYGVYAFLEEQLGLRWYTTDYTHIPHTATPSVPDSLYTVQHPAIPYRLDYCHDAISDNVWCARNRLNMQVSPARNAYGDMTAYWGAHTFQKLLPPDEYFKSHPEYFSLRDGKRTDKGQLCLSNPNVLRLVTERLGRYILANPECWGYDVSQNDNQLYCQCRDCNALAQRYGGQSGLMLWFVNQVAATIAQTHPGKYVGTLAYEYTRRPPRDIRPADNVLIRLCDIECCFLHPLDQCQPNKAFISDLQAWHEITDRIFVWDYLVNFHYYHLPFPSHRVLGPNISLFRQYGVKGILELGAYDANWSDFSEMRQWMTAKLLWNPDLDADSLAHTFITDYYGPAANDIWTYYRQVYDLATPNVHTDCHADPDEQLYTAAFRRQSLATLEHAETQALQDPVCLRRVRRVLAQALYTRTLLDGAASLTDGTYLRLKRIIDEDPTTMRERGQTINQYLLHHGYI